MHKEVWQNFMFLLWFLSHHADTLIDWYLLKFIALEYDSDIFRHAWCYWSLFIRLYRKSRLFGRKNDDSLRYGSSIYYFYNCCVRLFKLISCKFDLRRVNLNKSISHRFLKIIYIHDSLHLEDKLFINLFSVFLKREPGTKVAFNSLPVLFSWSAIQDV